mgnify:FL=1
MEITNVYLYLWSKLRTFNKTLTISLSQEARVLVFISVMFDGVQGGSPIIKWFTDDASGRIEQYTSENLYVPLGGELILDPQCEDCEIHFLDDMDYPPVGISGNFSSSTDFENYRYTNRDGKVTGTIQLGNSYDEITLTIY